jgi:hypothetical protein
MGRPDPGGNAGLMTDLTMEQASVVRRLEDEAAVRDLGHRFADACNRGDVHAFGDLWYPDSVWVIDHPVDVRVEHAGNDVPPRHYDNHARYDDQLVRTEDGWRYLSRHYQYYWIDQDATQRASGRIRQ